uniref:Uncharacterized protein n=1 Tax=Timema genevievae TaxID=629358 RepID=A0A7R9JPJ2_TIMGE|nr:unnamed protein product [Timema genevievae]
MLRIKVSRKEKTDKIIGRMPPETMEAAAMKDNEIENSDGDGVQLEYKESSDKMNFSDPDSEQEVFSNIQAIIKVKDNLGRLTSAEYFWIVVHSRTSSQSHLLSD